MNLNNRLTQLEKLNAHPGGRDVLKLRPIDYRAGIAPDVIAAADAIPVTFTDYNKQEAANE